jgi:hypothetical protein
MASKKTTRGAPRPLAATRSLASRDGRVPPVASLGGMTGPDVPPQPPASAQGDAVSFPACSSPDVRTPPQFVITFRRALILTPSPIYTLSPPLSLACVQVTAGSVVLGLDPRFAQTWNLTSVAIGDLASTMSLAPLEQLTLEFQSTQRKVLDRTSIDSTESMDSSESTTSDKEAINVTRASTKTQNWHVDTSGTLTCGAASLKASAGYSKSVTDSNQQTVNHITETTKKSAHSLKTLHKIEVHGVTESVVTNRMTRVLKNPYYDRTMTVNVFQLLKHFSVHTAIEEVRSALVLRVDSFAFDSHFVVSNGDFLRTTLLDSALADDLSTATQGALPPLVLMNDARNVAAAIARRALHLLFDDVNIFTLRRREHL